RTSERTTASPYMNSVPSHRCPTALIAKTTRYMTSRPPAATQMSGATRTRGLRSTAGGASSASADAIPFLSIAGPGLAGLQQVQQRGGIVAHPGDDVGHAAVGRFHIDHHELARLAAASGLSLSLSLSLSWRKPVGGQGRLERSAIKVLDHKARI